MSEGKLSSVVKNVLTSAPYTIYQAGLLGWLVTGKAEYGFFVLLCVLLGDGMNAVEKAIAKFFMGSSSRLGQRPSGCGAVGECTGCGIYPSLGSISSSWGMPSGHAQITALAATYWTLRIWFSHTNQPDSTEKRKQQPWVWVQIALLWFLVSLVCLQRVLSKCHSAIQVGAGFVIGCSFGALSYWISESIFRFQD